eukprot:695822-Pyramimonas_sp.AAC.1
MCLLVAPGVVPRDCVREANDVSVSVLLAYHNLFSIRMDRPCKYRREVSGSFRAVSVLPD